MALRDLIPGLRGDAPTIPVVRLSGVISAAASPIRPGLTFRAIEGALNQAFAFKAPEVALVINSPGGAAVQSHMIYRRIRALADERGKRVIAAVEDVAASGGYMIACAADEIIVDVSSIVGSIGVISAGFGFQRLLDRIGVERRVHTSGRSKAMLDPFQPEREEDVARLKAMQDEVHAAFIDLVRSRRPKLASDPDLFSGAFWSGRKAIDLGLADRVGDLRSVLRERFGPNVRLRVIPTDRSRWWRRRLGLAARSPLGLVDEALAVVEERLLWERYGL
jgi:signal peptide peptidase SppA